METNFRPKIYGRDGSLTFNTARRLSNDKCIRQYILHIIQVPISQFWPKASTFPSLKLGHQKLQDKKIWLVLPFQKKCMYMLYLSNDNFLYSIVN